MTRAKKQSASVENKLAFYERHPFIVAFCAALMCLCVKQKYQLQNGGYVAQSGIQLSKGALVLVICLVLFFVGLDYAKAEKDRLRRLAMYALFGCVTVVVGYAYIETSAIAYIVPVVLLAACVQDYLLKNSVNGTVVFVLVLSVLVAFGVSTWTVALAALAVAAFVWSCGMGIDATRRGFATALPLIIVAVAYYVYDGTAQAFFACGALVAVGIGAVFALYDKLTLKQALLLMFAVGFVARICYVLSISGSQNQHDVWSIGNTSPKHNAYIKYIYENWSLPQTKENLVDGLSQYYHPPLHHIVAALWIKLQTLIGFDFYEAYENVQYLTVFYSTAVMLVSKKLFETFGLKAKGLAVACAVIAFHPTFYIMAGSVNNDILCLLFMVIAMLYCVRFYREQSIKNTVLLALAIGLAMMTKLNGAMVAVGVGGVFLYMLVSKEFGGFKASFSRLWQKFVLFGAICCPLGLWWQLYTNIKFDLPLGHVPSMSKNSTQYIGDHSFFERIFGFDYFRIENIYPNIGRTDVDGLHIGEKFYEHGILPYSFKSSLFGEYFWRSSSKTPAPAGVPNSFQSVIGYILVIAALALAVLAVYAMFRCLAGSIKRNNCVKCVGEYSVPMQFMLLVYAALFGSYVVFCFKYPFTCTMDFRYIAALLPVTAIFLGKLAEDNDSLKLAKPLQRVVIATTAIFAASSLAFYSMYF